jgi:DNA-binding NarL/FixJ family response regulator
VKILLADDHDLIRETITVFLVTEGFETVSVAATPHEALCCSKQSGPYDLELLD